MNGSARIVEKLFNGDLHKFKSVKILSGNGYQIVLQIEEIEVITIYIKSVRINSESSVVFKLKKKV